MLDSLLFFFIFSFQGTKLCKKIDIRKYFSYFLEKLLLFSKNIITFAPHFEAQMAESVDALVSNTSGATRAGSTPALGT